MSEKVTRQYGLSLVFGLATLLRAILYAYPPITDALAMRVELSNNFVGLPYSNSPVTTIKSYQSRRSHFC
jgi:hypothetical protein